MLPTRPLTHLLGLRQGNQYGYATADPVNDTDPFGGSSGRRIRMPARDHGLSVTPDGHPTTPCGPDVNMNNALGCNAATVAFDFSVLGLFAPPGPGEVVARIAIYGGGFSGAIGDAVSC